MAKLPPPKEGWDVSGETQKKERRRKAREERLEKIKKTIQKIIHPDTK